MARKRRRGLGDAKHPYSLHLATANDFSVEVKDFADDYIKAMNSGNCRKASEAAKDMVWMAGRALKQVEECEYHDHYKSIKGLAGGCRDARGFVPVPACRGHHVPRAGGSSKPKCQYGRSKTTGRCLKRPRRK